MTFKSKKKLLFEPHVGRQLGFHKVSVPFKSQNPEKTKTFAPALVKSVLASFKLPGFTVEF
jgi:hypothetical protein